MTTEADDAALAGRAVGGDRLAFLALYRRHAPAVTKFVRSFGAPVAEVEDLAQEVFLRAWRALGDYDRVRPFRGWLFQIALNCARDAHRRRRVRDFFFGARDLDNETLQIGDDAPSPEISAHDRRTLTRVADALKDIPPDQRAALLLTAVSGLSYPEAAAAMGVSVKAIEGRIARARQRLNQQNLRSQE